MLLNATQKIFSAYCDKFTEVQNSLNIIASAWNNVKGGFETIRNKILYAQKEISVQEWQKINTILKDCQELSIETAKMLEDLQINDTVISKASFKIGMSGDDVSQSVESADQVTFTEYMLVI